MSGGELVGLSICQIRVNARIPREARKLLDCLEPYIVKPGPEPDMILSVSLGKLPELHARGQGAGAVYGAVENGRRCLEVETKGGGAALIWSGDCRAAHMIISGSGPACGQCAARLLNLWLSSTWAMYTAGQISEALRVKTPDNMRSSGEKIFKSADNCGKIEDN